MFKLRPQHRTSPSLADNQLGINWPQRFAELAQQAQDQRLIRYYQAGMLSADTPIKDVPLLAIDFETTGFEPHKDGILSIGLVPMTLQRIYTNKARHWLLKPKFHLTESSVVIHGITHNDIIAAPDIMSILDELLTYMAGTVPVVHFRGIERPFLQATLLDRIGESIQFPVIDTMDLEARLHRRKPASFLDKLLGKQPVSIRLADSRRRYNLPDYSPHHAVTDSLASAELLQAQIADRFSPDTPISELWK